jgi:hypothetical protein
MRFFLNLHIDELNLHIDELDIKFGHATIATKSVQVTFVCSSN